jgi:hypothetical protein
MDDCVDISRPIVRRWAARVRDANLGHGNLNDRQCNERPQTATDMANQNGVDEITKDSRRFSQQAI